MNARPAENNVSLLLKLKTFYRSNPVKGRLLLALSILILVLVIARLALSSTIIYATTSWLEKQGIDASIEDIRINLMRGTVSLIDAKGYKDDKALFNIGLIDLHWEWSPLSQKTVEITRVVLDNLKIDIAQYNDEIIIGGLHIPLGGDEAPAEQEPVPDDESTKPKKIKPWAAALNEVVFSNLNVCYLQDTASHAEADSSQAGKTRFVDYCVDLKEMTWGGTISYATDQKLLDSGDLPLTSTGDFRLNGLTVTDNRLDRQLLFSKANTLTNVVLAGLNDIHLDRLEMNGLSVMQRDDDKHKDALRFQQLAIDDINLKGLDTLSFDAVSFDQPGLYIVKLNATDWEYSRWIPGTGETANKAASSKATAASDQQATTTASSFTVSLNSVQVSGADFCYLDAASKVYYCFNQDQLKWQGPVFSKSGDETKLSLSGNLSSSNTKIYNPKLERDLLTIKNIAVNKLQVKDLNDVAFNTFTIEQLNALQRGAKADDSTAAFSKLAINDAHYTGDAVVIDTIKLDGLSSLISRNKDGSWEFDKWPTGADKEPNTPPAKKPEPAAPAADDSNKPMLISLKKAEINTDKDILYIDNSTTPTMKIGLNKLMLDIEQLDSKKPNTDSPFKLSAKTTRHSTIDIAGTIRPLADKISFDAKGKLKGFDLRAASPAVQQAIGHIIKSGQMDADLKLLAKDGILDSNIALSLYQFNIKAQSKKDAEKLDKQFGMPLNQTLVLLRDKDDSIHLDIPITGDINKPNFNPMDAIVKATSKAATVTLITFYTPYGLAYAGGTALFDIATALDFEPLKFKPGSAEMPDDSEQQLKKMSQLLKEKPQVHLTLCGMSNTEDAYALYPALKEKAGDNKPLALDPEQRAALENLANDRQINSKNYLVEKAAIEHERLILCAPEFSSDKDAIAGVEINI